jgi:hypothetical protein
MKNCSNFVRQLFESASTGHTFILHWKLPGHIRRLGSFHFRHLGEAAKTQGSAEVEVKNSSFSACHYVLGRGK